MNDSASRNQKRTTVAVIGAGIVGVSCALHLQRKGFTTVLIDRLEPGEATSFGNAGVLATHGVVPAAVPGIVRKIPAMLADPMGPLSLRWRHALGMMPWFWRFLRHATQEQVARVSDALAYLCGDTIEQHWDLARDTPAGNLLKAVLLLDVYRDEAAFRADNYGRQIREKHGERTTILKSEALVAHEPVLSREFGIGVLRHGYGYVLDPGMLVKGLVKGFLKAGGTIKRGEVKNIECEKTRATHLVFSGETLAFDHVVVAAGAWSARFAKKLGNKVPLEAERGYHITLTDPGLMPVGPVVSKSGGFIATPMAMGLRLAGLAEFGGLDAPADDTKIELLLKQAKILFPNVRTKAFTSWMGQRPTLPDSLPVIGRSPHYDNVYFAFGHQHLGLTMGPKTGKLIADLIQGHETNIDLSPFRIDRF